MSKYTNMQDEHLLTTYLLIQKDINECNGEEEFFEEMITTSLELRNEILRRMKNGSR